MTASVAPSFSEGMDSQSKRSDKWRFAAIILLYCSHAVQSQVHEVTLDAFEKPLHISIRAVSSANWSSQLPKLQHEITALQQIFDPTLVNSELSQWQRGEIIVSPMLSQWLERCEYWWQQTQGYSCRLGRIRQLWLQAELSNQLPDRVTLRQQVRALHRIKLDSAKPTTEIMVDSDGYAAAAFLDALMPRLQQLWPTADQYQLRLAGITLVRGAASSVQVEFTAPNTDNQVSPMPEIQATNADKLQQVLITQQALAYSMHSQHGDRPFQLSHRRFHPLLNPADGWPVDYGPQVAAIATDAAHAWLLAQSLASLPAAKHKTVLATAWQSQATNPSAAALLKPEVGSLQASEHWYRYLLDPTLRQSNLQLTLDYQLPKHGLDAKRPYLAIWIENAEQRMVRQLTLQGQQERWLPELRSWWQRQRQQPQAVDQISSATRKSGWHRLSWDGRDNQGMPVTPGQYTLQIEISREHGGREKLKFPLHFTANAQAEHQGKLELGILRWHVQPIAESSPHS